MSAKVLFMSNGHGEDTIAGRLIDSLMESGLPRHELAGWPMVGEGNAYSVRGIPRIGPRNLLPSEGFGTLSAALFLRDLRAGWVRTHLAQIRFARGLRGRFRLVVAVGDVVPLAAGALSGVPVVFVSCAKSAHYGGRDGHTAVERMLMRRCRVVFARDELTSLRLMASGVANLCVGNPMMDGLEARAPERLRNAGGTGVLLLPGSRRDATSNALFLLDCLSVAGNGFFGWMPCTQAVDFTAICDALTHSREGGWQVLVEQPGRLTLGRDGRPRAVLARDAFADLLDCATFAVGMAGTANEQAIGRGLPLIVVPGAGNQGTAYVRMKRRWYGRSALHLPRDAQAIAARLCAWQADPAPLAEMIAAGAVRMGQPGGSAAIARAIRAELDRVRND